MYIREITAMKEDLYHDFVLFMHNDTLLLYCLW